MQPVLFGVTSSLFGSKAAAEVLLTLYWENINRGVFFEAVDRAKSTQKGSDLQGKVGWN